MTDKAIWSERVSEWRSSGLSSPAFCTGKSFTAGGLRYWAHRLQKEECAQPAPSKVRMARVVRTSSLERGSARARAPRSSPVTSAPAVDSALIIELGEARVSVRPGFDKPTLASVLDVLGERGGGR